MSELVCVFYMGNKMSVPGVHRRVLPGVGVFMDFRNFFFHISVLGYYQPPMRKNVVEMISETLRFDFTKS